MATQTQAKSWKLEDFNDAFYRHLHPEQEPPKMTQEEIKAAIKLMRKLNYAKPSDCPWEGCPKLRPTCKINICHIAINMCGDF